MSASRVNQTTLVIVDLIRRRHQFAIQPCRLGCRIRLMIRPFEMNLHGCCCRPGYASLADRFRCFQGNYRKQKKLWNLPRKNRRLNLAFHLGPVVRRTCRSMNLPRDPGCRIAQLNFRPLDRRLVRYRSAQSNQIEL